ncbi:MAG: response regulator [Candidatus Saccharibacteria bacterium]|nr:response regulator [Candidatus Saccharibacteria bacterium]
MQMRKVVVIEDEHALAAMYAMKLENSGFEVSVAHNGKEGLSVIKEFEPNLILLDLRMPVMSGDDMLEKLRQEDWGANIRVIVLTNISRDEAPSNLGFLGVDRYVVKAHYTPGQVVEIAHEILNTPMR